MARLAREGCSLDYELIDIAAPWMTPGETVVLHHGVGASRELWAAWLPALVDRYRVLRFDMRGHGASTWAEGAPSLTLDTLTDDLFAVMDAAGVEQAHLVGESIGGTIALNAALRVPERIHTLTVSNGAHLGASIQAVQDWRAIIETRGMAGWSAHLMPRRFFEDGVPSAVAHWFETLQASAHPEAVFQMLAALVGADTTDQLPGLRPPLMLLHPDSSPFIPLPVICDFMARVPAARLHVIGRARHGMPLSHARTCAALLRDFLSENRSLALAPAPP
jgi:pimeloyl-ACP methyl ester carboxylesterase